MSVRQITFSKGFMMVSSMIDAAGYDVLSKKLGVRFQDGSTYVYEGVSSGLWSEWKVASSKGKFFRAHIAAGYAYACVPVAFKTMWHLNGLPVVAFKAEDYKLTEAALSDAWF